MLNRGVLLLDANNRIRNHSGAGAIAFNGGTPVVEATQLFSWTNAAPQVFHSGLGYRDDGTICAASGGAVSSFTQGGLPVDSSGILAISIINAAIAGYVSGIPVDSQSRPVITAPE